MIAALGGKSDRLGHVEVDPADPSAPQRLVDTAVERFGPLDSLVVNHGRSQLGRWAELEADTLDAAWAVHNIVPIDRTVNGRVTAVSGATEAFRSSPQGDPSAVPRAEDPAATGTTRPRLDSVQSPTGTTPAASTIRIVVRRGARVRCRTPLGTLQP